MVGSSCLAGAAVVWVGTFAAYSEAPVAPLAAASCSWIACALAFLAISVGLSAMIGSTLGAVGASIGVYVVCTLLALAEPGRYSPAGLVSLPSAIASGGGGPVAAPLAAGALAAAAILALGARSFARREL